MMFSNTHTQIHQQNMEALLPQGKEVQPVAKQGLNSKYSDPGVSPKKPNDNLKSHSSLVVLNTMHTQGCTLSGVSGKEN